jgi:uncharacterized protein (TIGR03067 family)
MRTGLIGLAALGFLVTTTSAQDSADDLKKLEGAWKGHLREVDGKVLSKDDIDKTAFNVVIKGDTYKVYEAGAVVDEGTFKLDAGKKPRHIDVKTKNDVVLKGIYKIEGDKMTVCFAAPCVERPSDFKTKEGQRLMGYTRAKE